MKQPVSSLRQWMLEQYAPQFHLEKKTLLKQLDQVGFYAERCLPPVGQRVNCQLVLNTCRLYLQTLCPEPPEGWLAFLYEEICQKMFPETGHSPMTPGQRQAAVFYLGLLRYAISRENCPFDPLTDIDAVTEAELEQSRIAKEYARFWRTIILSSSCASGGRSCPSTRHRIPSVCTMWRCIWLGRRCRRGSRWISPCAAPQR